MDKILLSHGSGGQQTAELIERHFHLFLDDPLLRKMEDAAVIEDLVFTTDSFVVSPLFFPGGDIGKLAICGTVNDLAVMGAQPLFISLAFIIEEGLPLADLETILRSIRATVAACGVRVVAADTKVVEKGKGDGLFINSSGIGRPAYAGVLARSRIVPGDLVFLSGSLGLHGAAVLLARSAFGLQAEIGSDVAPLWPFLKAIAGCDVKFMRDPTRGGVAQSLNEMTRGQDWGVEIGESVLPVEPAVTAICDILGLDPLALASEGRVVGVVAAKDADRLLAALRSEELGRQACLIGRITAGNRGLVVLRTKLGLERILMSPTGEIVPRIC
jgi:hydrogenase expression/formation protein HypE